MAHHNSSSVKSYGRDYLHEAPKPKGYMGSPTCDTFYPELKGACNRNCYARYKKMRAAIKAMEGKA